MTESKSFNRVATIILTFLVIVTLLPIVLLVIASFTKEQVLIQNGYTFFPKALSLDAYYYMVKQGIRPVGFMCVIHHIASALHLYSIPCHCIGVYGQRGSSPS